MLRRLLAVLLALHAIGTRICEQKGELPVCVLLVSRTFVATDVPVLRVFHVKHRRWGTRFHVKQSGSHERTPP